MLRIFYLYGLQNKLFLLFWFISELDWFILEEVETQKVIFPVFGNS